MTGKRSFAIVPLENDHTFPDLDHQTTIFAFQFLTHNRAPLFVVQMHSHRRRTISIGCDFSFPGCETSSAVISLGSMMEMLLISHFWADE
jgi:hypothetical protein